LAIGYIWLINAWILFAEDLPRTRPQDGVLATIWDLATAMGTTATLVAVTFSAYIIGSILEVDPQAKIVLLLTPIFFPWRYKDDPRRAYFEAEYTLLPKNTKTDLRKYIREAQRHQSFDDTPKDISGDVISEVPQIATRLQVINSELYGRYDRLLAEASIRINLAIPLMVLLVLVIGQSHLAAWQRLLLAAAAFGVSYLMARKGVTKIVAARDVVIQALLSLDEVRSRRIDETRSGSSFRAAR
jgi:hypothetical protein